MRLTSRTDYALRAAMELAAAGERPLTTTELGKGQAIPSSYLGAVLAELRRGGIVKARRGPEGGWTLAKSAKEISLADVIRAVDGTLANVAGTRPETLAYKGAAKGLRSALVAKECLILWQVYQMPPRTFQQSSGKQRVLRCHE